MKKENHTLGKAVALVLYTQFCKHPVGIFFTASNKGLQVLSHIESTWWKFQQPHNDARVWILKEK